jgi:hypothetical protein
MRDMVVSVNAIARSPLRRATLFAQSGESTDSDLPEVCRPDLLLQLTGNHPYREKQSGQAARFC